MPTPWTKGASETLFTGYGKEFRRTLFTNPSGQEREFFLFGQRTGVEIFPVTTEGMVVAVRQYKQGCDSVILELPDGVQNREDELLYDAARRELLEETGYTEGQLIQLGDPLWMAPRNSWSLFYFFLALDCVKVGEPVQDPDEEIEVVLISLDEWIQMAERYIAVTSAAALTLRAMPYLRERFEL